MLAERAHALSVIGLADERDQDPVVVERELVVGAQPRVDRARNGFAEAEQTAPRRELLGQKRVGLGGDII